MFRLLLVLGALLTAPPARAGTGTPSDPFTSLGDAYSVSVSGRFFFNLGSGTFAADVDTSQGGGWVLVLQYVHQGGTNPALSVRGAGADLPVMSAAALGTDETGIAARWGHAGNDAMSQFAGDIETRWFGQTSGHTRVVHFRTRVGSSYLRSGIGSMSGLGAAFTPLTAHNAFTPGTATLGYSNKGDFAATNFPFYEPGARHWAVRGEGGDNVGGPGNNGNRWEVDDFPNDFSRSTIHRVWVRSVDPALVINTNDSGAGSLRSALIWANANPGPSVISFAIAGAGPHTITLSSALPNLTAAGLIIDGTTQSGTQCRDLWAGSGHDLRINLRGGGFDGLRLSGASQTVRGLALTGFATAIETLSASSAATIQCNYLGLPASGTSSGNTWGIRVNGASARIGGLAAGEGNVISANSIAGIVTQSGSTDTAIRGNFIGTDPTGLAARANGTGINNFFGTVTWRDITRNLIAGNNGNAGIVLETDDRISPSDGQIRIQANVIGANRTATALLANGGDGVLFDAGSITGVLIGGTASTEGNTIAATIDGIDLRSVSNITIRGNTITRSGGRGITLNNASAVEIGGVSAGQGNSIGGNATDGIYVTNSSTNITVYGNLIQPITFAGSTTANGGEGIWLDRASNVTIGNGTAAGRNVIGGNLQRGIRGSDTNASITINGNYIGTDASGNAAVASGQSASVSQRHAIIFESATVSNIAILNNVIGGYGSAMIRFNESTANGVTIQGNNLGVGANGTTQIVSGTNESLIAFVGSTRNYANVTIGGFDPGQGNLLANGGQNGITISSVQTGLQVIGNTIRNNSGNGVLVINPARVAIIANRIFGNGMLGIDLGADGATANDPGDGDSGANDLLNFPQIIRAIVSGPNQLGYNVTLVAPAAANGYRLEFFANSAADATGFGEGERYLGAVDIAHGGGAQSYTGTLTTLQPVAIGDIIAATTTRRTAGGAWDITSEFSAVATADGVAALMVAVSSEVFDPPADNLFATPGNEILLATTVSNSGNGSTDADSIFAVISINAANSFYNEVTPAWGGIVAFSSASPGLTFTPATDLRFSNAAIAPSGFGQCTYTPSAGYDPQVRHVCLNPKGILSAGGAQGQFTLRLRARIN